MNTTNQNTALLVMDMQSAITQRVTDVNKLIAKVSIAIEHARKNKIHVIYVVVGFRPGMPEVSVNNKSFTLSKKMLENVDLKEWSTIISEVAPLPGEVVVTKRRISAFTGSDLEVVLRAYDIQHLVLSGVSTSGVVLSTTREAADKDYRLSILSDCCEDPDPEVHGVLINKIFPRQAEVLSVEEWCNM